MIDLIVELKKQIEDDSMIISLDICSMNGESRVHCNPEYMYGQTDLTVKHQAYCVDAYRISKTVKGIEFFTLVNKKQLEEEFPHLIDEVSA